MQKAISGGMENPGFSKELRQCWHRGRDDAKVHLDDTCGVSTLGWNSQEG